MDTVPVRLPAAAQPGAVVELYRTADEMFYVLACRECDAADRPLIMPFGTAAERGKWAAKHTRGTGHDHWWIDDQVRPGTMAAQIRIPAPAPEGPC